MQRQQFLFTEEMQASAKPKQHIILPPPQNEQLHDVFAETMLEKSSVRQRRSPLDWAISLMVHVIVLGTLLLLPLYFTTGLDVHKYNLTFLAPPLSPAAPPPPPMRATSSVTRAVQKLTPRTYTPDKLTAPSFIPKVVASTPSEVQPDIPMEIAGGIPGGIPGGQVGGVLGGVLSGVPAPAVRAPAGPKTPVRIGGNLKPPRLIFGPDPVYPTLARQARISGTVVIEAIIDEKGVVTGMRVISGPPLLVPAALSAVAKRKYEPTVLDGDPTPIDLRVEISFSVG
jgi:periplasmic protein TonB